MKKVKRTKIIRKKPVLSSRDKAMLRRIMKKVRLIKIYNLQHAK